MAVIDSARKEIQMNAPAYRGKKRLYKVFKNNKLVWQDKHTPSYSLSLHHPDGNGTAQATITQNEPVPYSVTYSVYVDISWNIWAWEQHANTTFSITFSPSETGAKTASRYIADTSYRTSSGISGNVQSITLGD